MFCIPATAAPVLAVLRRGPSQWFHVGRWDIADWTYEPGAWFRGRLFPQKCDVSPDGRWLAYSAQKPTARWAAGTVYEAISRLPWLHALAAWEAGTTYSRGIRFDGEAGTSDLGVPDAGDATACLARYGLRVNPAQQFAVERRRGWRETADTAARDPEDTWDERRLVRMSKAQPTGAAVLEVEGSYAAFRDSPERRETACYSIVEGGEMTVLEDAQWADWSGTGQLLVATIRGSLEAYDWRGGALRRIFEQDLSGLAPDPVEPPPWAYEW